MQAPEVTLSSSHVGSGYSHADKQAVRQLTVTVPALPPFLRRWYSKFQGMILMALALLGGLSLATWTVSDPSLTFANGAKAENLLGFWGASFADFSMQFLGFAAIATLLPLLSWGLNKVAMQPVTHALRRFGCWIASLVILAAALACLSIPSGWPLQVGLGGVIGDAVLSIPKAFIGSYPGGIFAALLFVLFAVPGIWLLMIAGNLQNGLPLKSLMPQRDDDAELLMEHELSDDHALESATDDTSGRDWGALFAAPMGLILHLAYSFSAARRKKRGTAPNGYQRQGKATEQGWVQPLTEALDSLGPEYRAHADESQIISIDDPHAVAGDVDRFSEIRQSATTHLNATRDDDPPIPHTDAAQAEPLLAKVARRTKPKSSGGRFALPALGLLTEQKNLVEDSTLSNEFLEQTARTLEGVLEDFGVKGQIVKVRPGPVVTLYELEPAPGVKSSRVIGLAEDIARSMSAIAARVAVVPGRNAIGIELPNKRRETVYLREQLSSPEFKKTRAKLAMCLGKTIGGEPVIADLAKMPHLLVAGTTGSGKSVAINTMILSLLYRLGPDQCKLIMIDPKMLELSIYDGIPHLLTPVVVDPKKAVVALKWTVREMEERYKKMSKVGVRNIDGFNTRVAEAASKGEVITRTVQTGFDRETGEAIYEHEELDLEPMPFIVVIIDETADLMMVAGKDIEGTVQRLAQMARAAGIHVIMATQRPSVDVITGTIKANFPTRISFQVTSKIDSRTILGEMGAEQLLGMGDMLYMAGGGRITRVHGPFVNDQEVEDVVSHLKAQGVPQYLEAVTEEDDSDESTDGGSAGYGGNMGDSDDPYDQAVAIVLRDRKASTSYIQRRLSVGYNKAASLIERMEQEGLISPANHAGKREILVPAEDETI